MAFPATLTVRLALAVPPPVSGPSVSPAALSVHWMELTFAGSVAWTVPATGAVLNQPFAPFGAGNVSVTTGATASGVGVAVGVGVGVFVGVGVGVCVGVGVGVWVGLGVAVGVGVAAPYVKPFVSVALVPVLSVTTTLTTPAACAGVVAVSCVLLLPDTSCTLVAIVPPNFTARGDWPGANPVPVMTTFVPPAGGPEFGSTLLMDKASLNEVCAVRPDERPLAVAV